ncbi:MAG: hypothetical protein JWN84_2341 [Nocardioides sp.]|nr:hypothetical protein [Nocardioides sp.]
MTDDNHTRTQTGQDDAWADVALKVCETPPVRYPSPTYSERIAFNQDPETIKWRNLGTHEWDLCVTIGRFGDDESENRVARHRRQLLRDHLPHLSADQLRAYIDGLHSGIDPFISEGI